MKYAGTKLLCTLFAFVTILSCKKDEEPEIPTPTPPSVFTALVTNVGTPVGAANSTIIGSGGGSILSDDGRLEIVFPPNALISDTEISIQPITNQCPGGVGIAYELSPHGMTFNEAIVLNFHYTEDDVIGSNPNVLDIATQHDDGIWYSIVDNTLDESTSIVSISTTHFSSWAIMASYSLFPWEATLGVNEALALVVYHTPAGPIFDNGGITQAPLAAPAPDVVNQQYISWSVNSFPGGTFNDGMMNPESGFATSTYTAPPHIANMTSNPVVVLATVDLGSNLIGLESSVTVEENGEQYRLYFESDFAGNYTTFQCMLGAGEPYIDGFEALITVNGNTVTLNELTNYSTEASFSSLGCTCVDLSIPGGSLIEIWDFNATSDGGGQLFYEFDYNWYGPDETIDCGNGPVLVEGTDFSDMDLGNFFLPTDSVVYDWYIGMNGTLKVVHIE